MEKKLVDPHNHAPEVSPADVWGDSEGRHPNFNAAATVLPPKRAKADQAARRNTEGLRINTSPQRRQAEDTEPRQLEVQEIDGSVVRLDPEEPTVAKVPRQVTFHELQARVEEAPLQRGEGKEWGRSRKQSVRWIIGTGMGVGTLVIVALMMLPTINKSNADREGQAGPAWVPEEEVDGAERLNDLLSKQHDAEQVFRKFASATIVDDVLPLLRDAETVAPLVRANFRGGNVSKDWTPAETIQWSVFDPGKTQYGVLEGTLPDFSKFRAYLVLSDNTLKLDWKASTCHSSATFAQLKAGSGDPSEIRATLTRADFYTSVFPESEFQSYQFISPDDQDAIWCYAPRSGDPGPELAALFQGGDILKAAPEPRKVTLRLERAPEGALPNQWLVAGMLHKDWLIP